MTKQLDLILDRAFINTMVALDGCGHLLIWFPILALSVVLTVRGG